MKTFAKAASALFRAVHRAAGHEVTYCRGTDSECIPANRGRGQLIVDDGGGGRIDSETIDWIVKACDLNFLSPPVPLEGDRLSLENGEEVYELVAPPYDPHDPSGVTLRLHSKLIS